MSITTKKKEKEFKQKTREAAKVAKRMIANPKTIEQLKKDGEKIEEKFITYESYLNKLYRERKRLAVDWLRNMPQMRPDTHNVVLNSLFETIREDIAFIKLDSAISNSILLLEYALRLKLYMYRQKIDPKSEWKNVASMKIRQLTAPLHKAKIITKAQKAELDEFNDKKRNLYMHLNIYELTKGITLDVTVIDNNNKEVKRVEKHPVEDFPQLWYEGKRKYDYENVFKIMQFCIDYVNKLFD